MYRISAETMMNIENAKVKCAKKRFIPLFLIFQGLAREGRSIIRASLFAYFFGNEKSKSE